MSYLLLPGTCFEENYKKILNEIIYRGSERLVRGFKTLEVSPFAWTTDKPAQNIISNKVRNINKGFMAAELLWILAGRNDLEMLNCYNDNIKRYSDNKVILRGAYGPRIAAQLGYIIDSLVEDPGSRQAVLTIWQERPSKSSDIPCTLSMQFLICDNMLDLIVTMRSNDAWLGLPYDVFTFTMIQSFVAMILEKEVGKYTHQAASEHLYEDNFKKAKECISEPTLMKEIIYTPMFETNELQETLDLEQVIRRRFIQKQLNLSQESIIRSIGTFSDPWKTLLNYLNQHLLIKEKKCLNG